MRQLSCASSAKRLSSTIFTLYPFSYATFSDSSTRSLSPASQYQSMKDVLRSTMEQRLALQILRRQSVMVVGWMRQQLITRSGMQPYDSWQVLRLIPHKVKGNSTFFPNSIRSNSCRLRSCSIRSFSSSLTTYRSSTRYTEWTPPSGLCGLFISGMMSSRSFPLLVIFSSSVCLLNMLACVGSRGIRALLWVAR